MKRRRHHVLHELTHREYGSRCSWWTSLQCFRHMVYGPRRRWKLIFQTKEPSQIELNGDLLWLTKPSQLPDSDHSVMQRICGDGRVFTMYKTELHPRPKELAVYDIPDPVFRSRLRRHEYRHVMCALRKGNMVTRHDLETGKVYNRIQLGNLQTSSMSVSFMSDMMIIKSPKMKFAYRPDWFFHFDLFRLHPFRYLTSLDISGDVFPGCQEWKEYGKMRNAEIHDDVLIVMTEKNYSLVYDARAIIKKIMHKDHLGQFPSQTAVAPSLLFATQAHLDILGFGGCPWTYIHAVSDHLIEVRDLKTGALLEGGQVRWKDRIDQQISPDYLMFHPDDSSRLIHLRTSELRVIGIRNVNGKRILEEEFNYPEKRKKVKVEESTKYSRSGRLIKSKFEWDDSLNRALVFNVETDLRVLVILEAKRDFKWCPWQERLLRRSTYREEHACTTLERAMFYDSVSYDLLQELEIGIQVEGDIETNRLSVNMERDVLNIVNKRGSTHTILSYRLKEDVEEDEDLLLQGRKLRKRSSESAKNRPVENGSLSDVSEDEYENVRSPKNGGRKRHSRQLRTRNSKRATGTKLEESSESGPEDDSDEWIP